jgi:signal transduction histidine kinase
VRLTDIIRSTTFRWTLAVAGAFAICIVLLFGFVYWQTAAYMTAKIDNYILREAEAIAADSPEHWLTAVSERLRQDPRRVKLGGLFSADGRRIFGNIESLPPTVDPEQGVQNLTLIRLDNRGREAQTVRLASARLANGGIVVIGRNVDEVAQIAEIVWRALMLGLLPALCLGVATGVLLSLRAQKRIEAVSRSASRIVAGDLRQRLPARNGDDPFDKLAIIVNGMLDKIEALIHEIAGVGDDIAHDLRTPLTRLRVRLERGVENAQSLDELRAVVERGLGELDQCLAIITALLRIAEIEHNRRLAAFGQVALSDIVREVGDLYEPIAEDKKVALAVKPLSEASVHGDRDLIFEAIANLVDNAVKFTPPGGKVELALLLRGREAVVRVADTGPGIGDAERNMVIRRFYRSDKSRSTEGLGLGLNLVSAIVKLHGFRLTFGDGPGCVAEIGCGGAG